MFLSPKPFLASGFVDRHVAPGLVLVLVGVSFLHSDLPPPSVI